MTECLISIINGKCFICTRQADYNIEHISGHRNYNIYYYGNPLKVFIHTLHVKHGPLNVEQLLYAITI